MLELVRSRTRRADFADRREDRGSYGAIVVSVCVAVALAFFLAFNEPAAAIAGHRETAYIVGVLLMLGGVAFRSYAIRVLGRSFTFDVATREDQRVCEAGPYRFIRHPGYAGTLLTIVGVGFGLGNWASLVAGTAAVSAAFAYRVRIEERLLCRSLGAPYAAYMKRTRRFIPFLF